MAQLYSLERIRRPARGPARATYFSRYELNRLLSLYSRHVISGEWRDYAIDQRDGMAVFSVFRHTHDRPLFSIAKRGAGGSDEPDEFLVLNGRHGLCRAKSLDDALWMLERRPKLIT